MILVADFQSVRDNDKLTASLKHAISSVSFPVRTGMRVTLDDLEGHTATGIVTAQRGSLLDVTVDWASYRDADDQALLPKELTFMEKVRAPFSSLAPRTI